LISHTKLARFLNFKKCNKDLKVIEEKNEEKVLETKRHEETKAVKNDESSSRME